MQIVVSKLKQRIALDHDKRNLKAAKVREDYDKFNTLQKANFQALFILIPILGCPYLLTLVGPSRDVSPQAYIVFQIVRVVVLSTQAWLAIFMSLS